MGKRFWSLSVPDGDDRPAELYLEGEIASETWFGDEVTPAQFRADLARASGRDVTVWINSPGGDVFAASVIYTALMEHKGHVTVKIEGLAASAASVIAMAGEQVLIAPTAYLMIHNPWEMACGNAEELRREADVLDEIAEGLVLAYQIKTGLSKAKIRQMMAEETWLSARSAVDMGFADGLLVRGECGPDEDDNDDDDDDDGRCGAACGVAFQRVAACRRMHDRIVASLRLPCPAPAPAPATEAERNAFLERLLEAQAKNMT